MQQNLGKNDQNKTKIVGYILICAIFSLPNAFLNVLDAKEIMPSTIDNGSEFYERWMSSGHTTYAIFKGINAFFINFLFNLYFQGKSAKKFIQMQKKNYNKNIIQVLLHLFILTQAISAAITIAAVGYNSIRFYKKMALFFAVCDFFSYLAPRFISLVSFIQSFDKRRIDRSSIIKMVRHSKNFQSNVKSINVENSPEENINSLLEKSIAEYYDNNDRVSVPYHLGGHLFDLIFATILTYCIPSIYAQKFLQGMNILLSLGEKNSFYHSKWLAAGYFFSFTTPLYYFISCKKIRTLLIACTHRSRSLYFVNQSSITFACFTLSYLVLIASCSMAGGSIRNIYDDSLAAGYIDYFPLIRKFSSLWRYAAYMVAVIINLYAGLKLILDYSKNQVSNIDKNMSKDTFIGMVNKMEDQQLNKSYEFYEQRREQRNRISRNIP